MPASTEPALGDDLASAAMTLRRTANGVGYDYCDLTTPWEGSGGVETVIFLHGIGLSRVAWNPWLRRFAHQYRTIRIDLRGHGLSEGSWRDGADIDRYRDDVLEVMDDAGVASAHLIGESFGGTIALDVAISEPRRVLSVTTCSTAFKGSWVTNVDHWPEMAREQGVEKWSEEITSGRFTEEQAASPLAEWVHSVQVKVAPQVIGGIVEALKATELEAGMDDMQTPVLAIYGIDSPFVDLRSPKRLSELVPMAEVVYVPGARHGVFLSHWDTASASALEFIRRHTRRDGGLGDAA